MRKLAELLTFMILTSAVSACALAPEGSQSQDTLQPDESETVQKEVRSCTSAISGGAAVATSCFNSGSPALLSIKDEKCDGHSVYVIYQINGNHEIRLENSAGCGHTAYVGLQSGSFTIQYKACLDRQFQGDICSRPITDFNIID